MSLLIKQIDAKLSSEEIFAGLSKERHVFFLDSSLHDTDEGRYSYIGFDPFDVFVSSGEESFDVLKEEFHKYKNILGSYSQKFPFLSGAVGCLGYDYGLKQEGIKALKERSDNLPDYFFGFYDVVLIIDHVLGHIYISSSGLPEMDVTSREARAKRRLREVHDRINLISSCKKDFFVRREVICSEVKGLDLKQEYSKGQYCDMVKKALDFISKGDIYQVNLSQKFHVNVKDLDVDTKQIYMTLRSLSPSSFAAYIDGGDFQIMSSSPEQFLQLQGSSVLTRPMKGTRPRGERLIDDERLFLELQESNKDKAELLMITDLERNDIGKVCDYGSVVVQEMRSINKYSTVFQAISVVLGKLQKDKDVFDLLEACFPGGSITGCPKLRSMQIIDELEIISRGFYTGSLGYIDFSGDANLNILIRTLVLTKNNLSFHVGGGIVSDSTPEGEYEETMIKARAMMECISIVCGKNTKH